jgi:hypothetical protein
MRFASLFRTAPSNEPRTEPQGQRFSSGEINSPQAAFEAGYERASDNAPYESSAYGESPVLDVIGGAADSSSARFIVKAADEAGSTAGDRLLGSLYEQYCQALDSPLATLSNTWVGAASGDDVSLAEQDLTARRWGDDAVGPVAAVLGDIHNVEQAFGSMHHNAPHAAAEIDDVPEVLRLFAPPEYHAAQARSPGAILPSLVRREHHTLAIDSPVRPLNTPHELEQKETY